MDQEPNTSTIILVLQSQVPPNSHLYNIHLKQIQSNFFDPYDHINAMENNNDPNHLVNAHEYHNK